MKAATLYLRVGILVVAGLLLAAGFVLFLAGARGSGATQVYETYSRESVQGLDVGAPVRYRGVPIGRVTEIKLVSAEYRRPEGVPYTEAFQLVLVRFAVDPRQIGEVPSPEEAIRLGLRARITAQGITGVNYVELDFVNPERFPAPDVPWTPRYPVLPTIPSTIAQVRGAAEQLVARLSEVPLEQMLADLSALLSTLNRQTSEGDVAVTLRETARAMTVLRTALEGGELEAALGEIRQAAAAASGLLGSPELRNAVGSISTAAAELRRAATRLPGAIEGFERTMRTARETTVDVQLELIPVLTDLRAAAASLRATAEQLRASPSQFLFGSPPTPDRRR
jgi:ABC-type transporter Mla subunit MlaD